MDEVETPSSVEFERRLLGAALRHPEAREAVVQRLTESDFCLPEHRAVYHVISKRSAEGRSLDMALVRDDLSRVNPEYGVSDAGLLAASVWNDAGAVAATDEYVTRIRACTHARALMRMATSMRVSALATEGDPEAVSKALMDADESIRDLTDEVVSQPWENIFDLATKVNEGEGALDPIFSSGFPDLDRILQGGFRPGQLVVVAARPAQGKSTLAVDIARAACLHQGVPGLMISMEMSGSENAARLMAAEGSVPLTNIQRNQISDDDRDRLDGVVERIARAPFYVVDKIEPSLPVIISTIISAHRRLGVQFVEVDYGQLITGDGSGPGTSREQIIANVSRSLKSLARSLGIVIILVAQLNRGPEQRTDKRPQVSDLRESGQLEQDGDIILLIFQPQTYDPTTPRGGEADIIVAKHRNGPTGTAVLHFQGHYARFVSATPSEAPIEADNWASASPEA